METRQTKQAREPRIFSDLAIDTTGLKVYGEGEGEWKVKKHGIDGKCRV
ncbi:hypothetical protein VIS19158_09382 [Vibrio scophthalmi LMG 19158]|uniref:Transposase n=1 Tax=Vibrio scophthalmi LMG 19158 TaxID=870967 RepID=F9RW59_9VIBR|nr:hypothetical protein VIS19158_09382 [Vibrio scophthalmi LMG 19158]